MNKMAKAAALTKMVAQARRILNARGYNFALNSSRADILAACTVMYRPKRHSETQMEYFGKFVRDKGHTKHRTVTVAPRFNLLTRDEYCPTSHPRAAEIDHLPHPVPMPWDGTGVHW